MQLQSALEERVVQAVRDAKDELVGLTAELVACDTTARLPGDPARDEEKLQRLLAARLEALGAEADLWEPEPTGDGDRFVPAGLDFEGRPQLAAALRGSGGGRSILLNGHIDAVDVRAARAVAQRPVRPHRARRLPLRPRRQRHEGRHRRPGDRPGDAAPPGRPAGRRRRLLHGHRRGVVGRRRPHAPSRAACRADAGIAAEATGFDAWVSCRGTVTPTITVAGRAGHAEMPQPDWRDGGAVNAIEKLVAVLDGHGRAARRLEGAARPPSTRCSRPATSSRPSSTAAPGW